MSDELMQSIVDDLLDRVEEQVGGMGGLEEEAASDEEEHIPDYRGHVHITKQNEVQAKRFGTTAGTYKVHFERLDEVGDVETMAKTAFSRCMDEAWKDAQPNELVGIEITHPALDDPIEMSFRKREEMTAEAILHQIEKVNQSKQEFCVDNDFEMTMTKVTVPSGEGTKRKFKGSFEMYHGDLKKKNGCLISIDNKDHLCLARAVVVAKARYERDDSAEHKRHYDAVRKGDKNRYVRQRRDAEQLMRDAGLENHRAPCGVRELQKIQETLPEYQIKVWSKEHYFTCMYRGPTRAKVLHLFHANDHYDVLTSMAAFFERSQWCEDCEVGYYHNEQHRCENKCNSCMSMPPCLETQKKYCKDCNRVMNSPECYDKHKANEHTTGARRQRVVPICDKLKRCKSCGRVVVNNNGGRGHVCGQRYCADCKEDVDGKNHQCYMPVNKKTKEKPAKFLFYDFETVQKEKVGENQYGGIYKHKPNCCVSWKVCDKCWETPEQPCQHCSVDKVKHFLGENCLEDFCKYLFSPMHAGYTCLAHNFRSFDSQFVLDYVQRQGQKPEMVNRGMKVLELKFADVRLIDSLSFMPMKLADMPAAFGFPETKGYFPHFTNSFDLDYVGPLPEPEMYGTKMMTQKDKDIFMKWYQEEKAEMERTGRQFELRNELLRYCELDVLVLTKGSMKFRDEFVKMTNGIDPFLESMTLPAAVSLVFRRNFLKPHTLALIPPGGYRKEIKQSVFALKFMKWYAGKEKLADKGQYIQHSGNEGEFKILNYHVDGLIKKNDGTNLKHVIEVNGCAYHGCEQCFRDRTQTLIGGKTAQELFEQTKKRKLDIEDEGYTVSEFWECKIRQMLMDDVQMKLSFDQCKIREPLDPRAAYYGGRCNATKLYTECNGAQKIGFCDVCSLYPFVVKYGEYMRGHPRIITENFESVTKDNRPYKGVMQCRISPPRGLYHPILPYKCCGKLMFPLCDACAKTQNQEECDHTEEERILEGTWVTPEIYKALEEGYKIVEIFEVWAWDDWAKYDGKDPETGLFTGIMDCFLKGKTESSGWPAWVKTDEDKQKFVEDYEKNEGIKLDPSRICKNPSRRQICKICVNSFYGKFGQRSNMSKQEYYVDTSEYLQLTNDPTKELQSIRIVNDQLVCVKHKMREEFVETARNTNVVMAAFITAYARLRLYEDLEKVGIRVCYMDTDSILHLLAMLAGEKDPELGSFVGMMTNELADYGEGSYIDQFVAGGPKQYGYRIFSTKSQSYVYKVKLRGLTINSSTANILNYENLKACVQEFRESRNKKELTVTLDSIVRNRNCEVFTKTTKKTYKVVYDKRRILDDGNTVPFGY